MERWMGLLILALVTFSIPLTVVMFRVRRWSKRCTVIKCQACGREMHSIYDVVEVCPKSRTGTDPDEIHQVSIRNIAELLRHSAPPATDNPQVSVTNIEETKIIRD